MRHPADRLGRRSLQRQPKSSPYQGKHGRWPSRDIWVGWQDARDEILRCAQDDAIRMVAGLRNQFEWIARASETPIGSLSVWGGVGESG